MAAADLSTMMLSSDMYLKLVFFEAVNTHLY